MPGEREHCHIMAKINRFDVLNAIIFFGWKD